MDVNVIARSRRIPPNKYKLRIAYVLQNVGFELGAEVAVAALAAQSRPVRLIDDEMTQLLSIYERTVDAHASSPA